MTTYAWAPGAPFTADANKVQKELERIRERGGGLTPQAVVSAARAKRSVLHPLIFNVGTEEAAEAYYHGRAQSLIKAIILVNEGEPSTIRSYVRMVTDAGPQYEPVSQPDARAHEIERLHGVLGRVRRMLHDLEVYPALTEAIDFVLEREAIAA